MEQRSDASAAPQQDLTEEEFRLRVRAALQALTPEELADFRRVMFDGEQLPDERLKELAERLAPAFKGDDQ